MVNRYTTLVRPIMTEKSSAAFGEMQVYTFECEAKVNKHEIRAAVEELFGVRVKSVRTLIQPAKRRTMGKSAGRRPKWKKAFVTLHEGDSIEIFEG
ncbi:MAG: 50S ribosomal protein L23 [Gemmatimonadota bacterium]|nr:50S ribosomal protein L23 [Gemmatimonadota bacterium]MDH5805743.1 50S ribosomal protein L23 [Gemmatimonadota bacterium]